MRAILLSLLFIPVALAGACGGSSDSTDPPEDAGSDIGKDTSKADVVVQDTGPGAAECVDASLANASIPDAALPGDSGSSVAVCVTCARTSCTKELAACDKDCDCKNALFGFYECQGSGKTFNQCAAANLFGIPEPGNTIATALGTCVFGKCSKECAAGQ